MTTKISDEQLLEFNKKGLIPGPSEDCYHFLFRARHCLRFSNDIEAFFHSENKCLPFCSNDNVPKEKCRKSLTRTQEHYDCSPEWAPTFFSNEGLAYWHGACSQISSLGEDNPLVYIQLRKAFRNSEYYFGIFSREDVLAHEYAHIGRMAFEEPKYEELIAYRCSTSWLRRWLGALVLSPIETWIFVISLFSFILIDYLLLLTGNLNLYDKLTWLKVIPLCMAAFASYRLFAIQKTFLATLNHLKELLGDANANAVIYRLTDDEIDSFAEMMPHSILQYAQENRSHSLRWRLLSKAYFL